MTVIAAHHRVRKGPEPSNRGYRTPGDAGRLQKVREPARRIPRTRGSEKGPEAFGYFAHQGGPKGLEPVRTN